MNLSTNRYDVYNKHSDLMRNAQNRPAQNSGDPGKDAEISALKAAKVPPETKRMAALLLNSGQALSADEAIIKAEAGEGDFKAMLNRKLQNGV